MSKKLLSVFVALMMVVSMFAIVANAAGYEDDETAAEYTQDWALGEPVDNGDGTYSVDKELFRELYTSLLDEDQYFILKDFRSYADAHKKIDEMYRDEKWWARTAMLNTASSGLFSADRTIQQYVDDIWKLEKITVELDK